jgi:protein-L-isoaspartate(D-aspartate) O-methyltransferase
MRDYGQDAERMVRTQLARRGIRNERVLAAMREVPRHVFVEENLLDEAYDDNPLPIGHGQTISQPYMVAIMTELLGLEGTERVLEIGTGSGYQAAILTRLCSWVYSIETVRELSERAERIIDQCGYHNITLKVGDGSLGWPEQAPFDAIIVTAGAPAVPEPLVQQLVEGGRLVIPVGDRYSQALKRVTKTAQGQKIENHTGCRFVDLIGTFGWPR